MSRRSEDSGTTGPLAAADERKACCVNLYSQPILRLILGESWHPGGLTLTRQGAEAVGLGPEDRLVDVACGLGASAVELAGITGCEAVGLDLSESSLQAARERAEAAGLAGRVQFLPGDAEHRPPGMGSFTVALCECAFCTFPDKPAAARALHHLLSPGGRLCLTDVTAEADRLPAELRTVLGAAACAADARPAAEYAALLAEAGFEDIQAQDVFWAARDLIQEVGRRILALEVAAGAGLALPGGMDFEEARRWLGLFSGAVQAGALGYVLIIARRL